MLEWNVYVSNDYTNEIEPINVFDCSSKFIERLKDIDLKNITFENFTKEVKGALFAAYCSKCEYEIYMTNGSNKELKVDIYDQIDINFEHFIKYLWKNMEEIKLL